jgi:hypothetical protein
MKAFVSRENKLQEQTMPNTQGTLLLSNLTIMGELLSAADRGGHQS